MFMVHIAENFKLNKKLWKNKIKIQICVHEDERKDTTLEWVFETHQ